MADSLQFADYGIVAVVAIALLFFFIQSGKEILSRQLMPLDYLLKVEQQVIEQNALLKEQNTLIKEQNDILKKMLKVWGKDDN